MLNDKIICRCLSVKYSQIMENIDGKCNNIDYIMKSTGATTCCGGCTSEVLRILEKVNINK